MNYTTPLEFIARNSYFLFIEPRIKYARGLGDGISIEKTSIIKDYFRKILPEQWHKLSLRTALENMADTLSTKIGQEAKQDFDPAKASRQSVQYFLRWALTGGRPGPSLMHTLSILGRAVSLERIEDAAAVLEKMEFEANEDSA